MSFFIDALRKLPDGSKTGRRVGEYWTNEEAIDAAKHLIDAFLFREFRDHAGKGIGAAELLALYEAGGEHPIILRSQRGDDSSTNISRFDARKYAAQRCRELCEGAPKD